MMSLKWRPKQVALGVPTSARVATACRFRLERVTWSKSINRKRPTPERSSRCAAWLPTPCEHVHNRNGAGQHECGAFTALKHNGSMGGGLLASHLHPLPDPSTRAAAAGS